jgi:hypothetical protein
LSKGTAAKDIINAYKQKNPTLTSQSEIINTTKLLNTDPDSVVVETARILRTDPNRVVVGTAPQKVSNPFPEIQTDPHKGSALVTSGLVSTKADKPKVYVSKEIYDSAKLYNDEYNKKVAEQKETITKDNFMKKAAKYVYDKIGGNAVLTEKVWQEIVDEHKFERDGGILFSALAEKYKPTNADFRPYLDALKGNTSNATTVNVLEEKKKQTNADQKPYFNVSKGDTSYAATTNILSKKNEPINNGSENAVNGAGQKVKAYENPRSTVPNFKQGIKQLVSQPEFVAPNGEKYYNRYTALTSVDTNKKKSVETSVINKIFDDPSAVDKTLEFSKAPLSQKEAETYKLNAKIHNIVNGHVKVSVRDEN